MDRLICFDSDGVVAKWDTTASQEEIYAPDSRYFLFCEVEMNARNTIFNLVRAGMKVAIVTAYPSWQAYLDKKFWFAAPLEGAYTSDGIFVRGAGLPTIPVIGVPYGKRKGDFVDEMNAVLVDDYGKNLKEWQGIGIKFYNGINGHGGTHYDYSVSYELNPAIMANYIAQVAAHGK